MMAIPNQMHPSISVTGPSVILRPFYFVVVFWGEKFRNYLVDYCLPSLLAPGNIPILSGGKDKFIFCTTLQDWEAIVATGIFATFRQCITPHFIEIPPAPPGKSSCEHMGIGHKLAGEMAHRDGAYGIFLTPDMMVSDGSVSALQRHARAGAKVVLVATLRFGEEPLFEHLRAMGVLEPEKNVLRKGTPLVMTSRQLVSACLHSFHSETLRYEWDAPYFTSFPSACWWKVRGAEGIVVHCLCWFPFLLDYSGIEKHETSALETWTLDGDYVYQNFGDSSDIQMVTDSDEIILVSWAPLADRPQSLNPNPLKMFPVLGDLIKGGTLRVALLSGLFDPLKLKLFFIPVRWHAEALTPAWNETEERAAKVLRYFVGDIHPSSLHETPWLRKILLAPLMLFARCWIVSAHVYQYRSRIVLRLREALRGDRNAWSRIMSRIDTMMRWILGVNVKHQ